jgi:hypothetical protein
MTIVGHLWEQRPADLYPRLGVPITLLLAHDPERDALRLRALDALTASGADIRVTWFRPGDHDLHAQFPERVAAIIAGLAWDADR